MIFHLMFVLILLVWFGLLRGHLLGNSCPLGWPYVFIVFCLFVFVFISHFGFKSGRWLLIVPVPVHCFSNAFIGIINFQVLSTTPRIGFKKCQIKISFTSKSIRVP